MSVRKNRDTPENEEFWRYVEQTSKEVEQMPDWKKGGSGIQKTESKDSVDLTLSEKPTGEETHLPNESFIWIPNCS